MRVIIEVNGNNNWPASISVSEGNMSEDQVLELLNNAAEFVERREPFGRSTYNYTVSCPHCGVQIRDMKYDADPIYQPDSKEICSICDKEFYMNVATVRPQLEGNKDAAK